MTTNRIYQVTVFAFLFFFCSCQNNTQTTSESNSDPAPKSVQTETKETKDSDVKEIEKSDSHTTVHGIDISKYQGHEVDKIIANDSVTFIICKATQGITYTDPMFSHNWEKVENRAGIFRGAYHFYVAKDDPVAQANHFVKTLTNLDHRDDLPPVLDIEEGSLTKGKETDVDQLQKDLLVFLKTVKKLTKRKPIVYTGLSFGRKYLLKKEFAEYPLWIAHYTDKSTPGVPDAWKEKGWSFWQRSGGAYELHSISTDYDVFNGSLDALEAFVKNN